MNRSVRRIAKFIGISFGLLIISCAQNPNLVSPSYSTIFSLIGDSFFKDNSISPETIKNIPYASALVNFKKSPKSLVILQSKQRDTYTWVSSDRRVFYIKSGRIVGTAGLPNDLYKVNRPDITFQEILNKDNITDNYIAYYSFKKPTLNNLKVEISIRVYGSQKVTIFEEERDLILVEESLINNKINWKRINRFWVDPKTFFVWKSEQNISPKLPMLTIEITKKPAQ